jgi:NAD(P)-dependent dehydrogenase (short-subunit alcohol dehydrogenase family)
VSNNNNTFTGKVALVTGGTSGIGKATKSLALEFAKQNIRINAVAPGPIGTEMWDRFAGESAEQMVSTVPTGRVGDSEEIAAAVLYLASDAAKFTIGTSLVVDGGLVAK